MFRSITEDGEFARMFLRRVASNLVAKLEQCTRAAAEAGDLEGTTIPANLSGWFAHHLGVFLLLSHLPDPPLPIDDKDGGCDDDNPRKPFKAWKKQHDAIEIADGDFVTDQGAEVYNVLEDRGIEHLFVMGVHTNMCVLNRTFAIKKMTRWGVKCVLIRDLTDAMYNPKKSPLDSHDKGTKLVIEHIEKYWCPTVLSSELVK